MLHAILLGATLPLALSVRPAQDTHYETLVAEHGAARAAFSAALRNLNSDAEYKAAAAAGDREAMTRIRSSVPTVDTAAFVARFATGAAEHSGTDAAIDYLTWILLNGRGQREQAQAAADVILTHHIDSPKLLSLAKKIRTARTTLGLDGARAFSDEIIDRSPHTQVRAWTLYWRASTAQRGRTPTEEDKAQAAADLAQAEKLAAPGSLLAMRIAAPKFEQDRLQIGMPAPDIAGQDVDGVPFNLSDYHGKVVVLDFWGDW